MRGRKSPFGRVGVPLEGEPDVLCVSSAGTFAESFSMHFWRGRLADRLRPGNPRRPREWEKHSLSLLVKLGDLTVELELPNDGRDLIEDLGEAREWLLKARRGE